MCLTLNVKFKMQNETTLQSLDLISVLIYTKNYLKVFLLFIFCIRILETKLLMLLILCVYCVLTIATMYSFSYQC